MEMNEWKIGWLGTFSIKIMYNFFNNECDKNAPNYPVKWLYI